MMFLMNIFFLSIFIAAVIDVNLKGKYRNLESILLIADWTEILSNTCLYYVFIVFTFACYYLFTGGIS